MNRRRCLVLCVGAVASLAGCGSRSSGPSTATATATTATTDSSPTPRDGSDATSSEAEPAPHLGRFVLWNDDDERHRVTLTVSRAGEGTVLVDETRDLGPGVAADVENPIETQGVYSIRAAVDDEVRAEREWNVSNCDSIEYLQVYVDDAGEVQIRTMRQTVDPPPTPC